MNQRKKFYKYKFSNILTLQKIVTVHYQRPDPFYSSETESHDFWEINYADKGEFSVIVGEKEAHLKQGDILFIEPNLPHTVRCGEIEPNIFIVSFDCPSEAIEFFKNKVCSVPENLRYLLQNVAAEAKNTFVLPDFDPALNKLERNENAQPGSEQVIKNSLELFLIYLLREMQNQSSPAAFFVSKVQSSKTLEDEIVNFLSERIYTDFCLDELCAALHYGKTYLCTTFRKKTGMSVYQTYLKLKIEEAKKLIRRKMSFSQIAVKLNFDSVPHFNSIFKKYANMTPGEYKNSIL
ncbi:MAG: helix-turn-helix domain-containing protein [Clostridia bacterium]|nr:helix-turn-helix domain-containing protein [Clostridia bacterium]